MSPYCMGTYYRHLNHILSDTRFRRSENRKKGGEYNIQYDSYTVRIVWRWWKRVHRFNSKLVETDNNSDRSRRASRGDHRACVYCPRTYCLARLERNIIIFWGIQYEIRHSVMLISIKRTAFDETDYYSIGEHIAVISHRRVYVLLFMGCIRVAFN